MKKILLIWEEIPENTKFFVMEFNEKTPQGQEDFKEQSKELNLIHKQYINTEVTIEDFERELSIEETGVLRENIETALTIWYDLINAESGYPEWLTQLSHGELINCKPDLIFHSGIIL